MAIRLKPDYPEAHVILGNALHDQGKLDEAIAEQRTAIRLKPDFAGAHNNLAWYLALPTDRRPATTTRPGPTPARRWS